MLMAEERMELEVLKKHGASIRELARATGRSRNTVRRYLREGEAAAVRRPAPKRVEKLDPFKSYIIDRVKAAAPDRIPAVVLYREIEARGYDGGETRVKVFVRGLVPASAPEPAVRFETEPGHQMQADWASVGRGADKLKVFIATLGWSRAAYVEFCDDEKIETLIRAHENALLAFGGVPAEILYDNMRTVVIERNAYGRGVHRFHAGFLDYSRHAGFLPRLRVWLATGHTDTRRGIPGLALLVQETLKADPRSGHPFAIRGWRGNLVTIIWHDGQGACLFSKRLERGRFIWPAAADGAVTILPAQLGVIAKQ